MKCTFKLAKIAALSGLLALPLTSTVALADYSFAKANFEAQPLPYRYTIQMLLGVAGYWPSVANDDYSNRLYDAITHFQAENGLAATGLVGSRDVARLHALADPFLYRWGMKQVRHPATNETLWIPANLVTLEHPISSGLAFQSADDSVAVAFNHFSRAGLEPIYRRLMAQPRDQLIYEKLKPDFFVIATLRGQRNSYSRFQATPNGVTGFTLSWENDDSIQGGRISTLMSDLFRAEFALGQDRYPPGPIEPAPAVAASPSYQPAPTPAAMSFAPQNAPGADPIQVAQEQARLQHEQTRLAQVEEQKSEKVTPAARQLIDDASALIKANPNHQKLLEFVEMINRLNLAIETKDARAIEKQSMILSGALHQEPAYAEVEAKRLADQKRTNAHYLGEAIGLAQRQKAFMLAYVAREPTSAATAAFLPLLREIDPTLKDSGLDKLQTFTEKVDLAIRQANLSAAFAATAAPLPASAADPTSASTGANLQVAATDKNRFLIEGDLDDVVLTMNASANAPHIARNLRGELVFQDGRADVCLFQRSASPELLLSIKTAVQQLKPATVYVAPSCDLGRIETYDVVAANRGAFLKLDSSTALGFIRELETDAFKKLVVLAGADLKRQSDDVSKASAAIAAGSREGYGVILLKTGSASICTVNPDKTDGHRQLLVSAGDRLALDMNAAPVLVKTSTEDAFVQAQRSQCGALYASSTDLKTLDAALTRENIDHRFAAVWFAKADIDAADKKALEAKAKAAQDSADLQRQAEDQRKLAAQRAADTASTGAAKQAELRSQYGRAALAAAAKIGSEIKDFTDNHAGPAGAKYPAYAAWLNDRMADHWEVMTLNSDVDDYGVSTWKDRQLDTSFARLTIKLKNRMLGEYQDACLVAGQIVDTEFSTTREPVLMPCERIDAVKNWKTAHRFISRWTIE